MDKFRNFTILILLILITKIGNAQLHEKKLIDSLFDLYNKNNCFNGELLISIGNKPFYKKAVGYRNIRTKERIEPNALFNIGSISKPFTAIAILQLQEKKLLSIEDKVQKYIPEFPYNTILIKHLLSHTSGLRQNLDQIEELDQNQDINNDSLIKIFNKYKPALFNTPGNEWIYSNLGYEILAVVVEKVSKKKFADYVSENIFVPAGMKSTYIPQNGEIYFKKNMLGPHMYMSIASCEPQSLDSVFITKKFNTYRVGSENVFSNTEDMVKFDNALRKNKILNKYSQELAYTPFVLNGGDTAKDMHAPIPSYYGMGWYISIDKSWGRIIWHKGRSLGSRSVFLRNPEKEQVVIMTDNFDYVGCDLKGIACLKIINHQPYRNPVYMSLIQKFGCGIYSKGFESALIDFKTLKETARKNYYISEEETIGLAYLLVDDKKLSDALLLLKYSKELYPKSTDILTTYADFLLRNSQPIDAEVNYKMAVELYSDDLKERETLLNNVGYQFLIDNRLNDSEFALKLNTELFPNSGNTFDSYATVLEKNNKLELAISNELIAIRLATLNNDTLLSAFKQNLINLQSKK